MALGLSIREFARQENCSDTLVRRKLKSGHLLALSDGTIDASRIGTDWRKSSPAGANTRRSSVRTSGQNSPGVRTLEQGEEDDDTATNLAEVGERLQLIAGRPLASKAEAERLKENYIALLKEIEYDRAVGNVVEVDQVVGMVSAEYALVRNSLLNLGSKLAPRLTIKRGAEEIKAMIDKEVLVVLQALSLDEGVAQLPS